MYFILYHLISFTNTGISDILMEMSSLRDRARALKNETLALYVACRDPRTPWYAKALGVLIVGYALSPIDLIPDFIPVLGYLDDIILLPLGIAAVLRMIPKHVMEESRARARDMFPKGSPKNKAAAVIVILIWVCALLLVGFLVYKAVRKD
jgi:uncharacterized membrane protein YkvA (DUF1232 family)